MENPEVEELYVSLPGQEAADSEEPVFHYFYGIVQDRFFTLTSVKAPLTDAMKTAQTLHFGHYEISETLLERVRNRKTDAQEVMDWADCIVEAVYTGSSEDGRLLLFEPKQIWKGTLKEEEQTLLYVRAQFRNNYDGKQLLPDDLKPGLCCLLSLSEAYFNTSSQLTERQYSSIGSISETDEVWEQYLSWAQKAGGG